MTSEITIPSIGLALEEQALVTALLAAYRPVRFLHIGRYESPDLGGDHARAGGDFDFVYIDGDASDDGSQVANEIEQLLPFLEESAYLLIHHAAHHRVALALDYLVEAHPDELTDCGMIGRTATWDTHHQAHYGGLRLLRYTRRRRLTVWTTGVSA